MFKIVFILLLFVIYLLAQETSRMQIIMSTFVTIKADSTYDKQVQNSFLIMKDVEKSLSSYSTNGKIYLLNKNKEVELDSYTYEALVLSKKYYEKTNGYFDISVGTITKDIYKFGEAEHLASETELKNAKINFNALIFDEKKAYLKDDVKVDLGGMGKGFGVDKVREYLKSEGIEKAVIAASGDIRCLGLCAIDIKNPFEDGVLFSFKINKKDLGISTSGTYNRYVKTQKNNHLIDPKKKKSQTKFVSITLIGEADSADLDAYTTAASVMPKAKAYEFLDSLDVAYIVVQSDGVIKKAGNLSLIKSDTLKK